MTNYASLILLLCLTLAVSMSCKSESAPSQETEQVAEPSVPAYPALGNEVVSDLYAKADKVDIIFFYLPVSVNQEDPATVKSTVLYISPAAPKITAECKSVARISWISDGTIIREADVYVADGCEYLLFMEDSKPVAANAMSQAGIQFFKNIISQVEQTIN